MPYSFTQIEKEKSGVIGFIVVFLSVFYVLMIAGFAVLIKCFLISLAKNDIVLRVDVFDFTQWTLIVVVGISGAIVHYLFSAFHLTERVLRWMRAVEPDPVHEKHRMFLNILEEISAATGGRKFHGVLIPETSLNAFALDDDHTQAVIGITEGALFRLNREQLEGVVAHEAAHILKGDCSTATLVSAMFEFYTLPIRWWMGGATSSSRNENYRLDVPSADKDSGGLGDFLRMFSRSGPVLVFFIVVIVVFYFFTSVFALLMRMLISREAKLRADAIAVRLTRNPIGLAQAIRLFAFNWRGCGSQWQALEGVFFVNPVSGYWDEKNGLASDIFSTHPPIAKRLNVLLDMAHCSTKEFDEMMGSQVEAVESDAIDHSLKRWFLQKEDQWLGPFTLPEIGMINWLRPQTPVKRWGTNDVTSAQDDPDLKMISKNKNIEQSSLCPVCKILLEKVSYEKEIVRKCSSCLGFLIDENQAGVVMMRREIKPGPEAFELARREEAKLIDQNVSWAKINQTYPQNGFVCPHCLKSMKTKAFNLYYPIVIDKCFSCGHMWFERGELELLQAFYEVKNPIKI